MIRTAALAAPMLAALLAFTSPAAAALTWTPTKQLPGRYTDVDVPGPPPVAVNRRGDVVVSWIGEQGGTEVAVGSRTRPAGFSKPIRMPRNFSGLPELAVMADGRAIVGWSDNVTDDEFTPYYAIVSPSGRAGPARRVDSKGFGQPAPAPQPNGSAIVVYSATNSRGRPIARIVRISSSGVPRTRTTLGRTSDDGGYEFFDAAPGGQIIVCCARAAAGSGGVWTYSPSKGWSMVSVNLARNEFAQSVATAGGAYLLRTNKHVFSVRGGRATAVAVPAATKISAAGLDASGGLVATAGAGDALFALTAAAGATAVGEPAPLGTARDAQTGPVIGAWAQGSLLAWSDRRRWRVATLQAGSLVPAAPMPTGVVGYPGLATAGDAAVLSWYDNNHHAFVSIGRP